MNTEERNLALQELKDMLKRMNNNFKAQKIDWEYRMIVSSFLETEVSTNTTPLSYASTSTRSSTPAQGDASYQDLNEPYHPTRDIEKTIALLDRDALAEVLQASLKKFGGANRARHLRNSGENSQRASHHSSSRSSSYSESTHSRESTPTQPPRANYEVDNIPEPSAQENNDTFIDSNTNDLYMYVKSYHTFPTNYSVTLNGVVTPIKWHHSRQAFTVLRRNIQEEIPYMGAYHAHDTIMAFQNAPPSPFVKDNLNRKCYNKHFSDSSGLAKAIRLLQEDTQSTVKKMIRQSSEDKESTYFQSEAFKQLSMVNFETGWSLTGPKYMDWAKGSTLSMEKVADDLDLVEYIPFVPIKYLDKERNTRARLVNHISGMDMLESLTNSLAEIPATASFSQAISRHFTPAIRDYTIDWMEAKLDVRKFVLQGQQGTSATNLLKSNMWEPTLFGRAVVLQERERKTTNQCLQANLGITKSFNTGLSRFGRNTKPDSLGNGYITRRSKGSRSKSSGNTSNRRSQGYRKPYEDNFDVRNLLKNRKISHNQKTQDNKNSEHFLQQEPQPSTSKNTQNNRGKSKNYGKKGRNFQKNRK